MSEFNNRIDAQRQILKIVNSSCDFKQELYGLSSGAIDRWSRDNWIAEQNQLLILLKQAAKKLFFLSNKSQEQITHDYISLSDEVADLTEQIRIAALAGSPSV